MALNWFKTAVLVGIAAQVGDLLSTLACIQWVHGREANPIVAAVLVQYGWMGLVGLKMTIALFPLSLVRAPEIFRTRFSKIFLIATLPTALAVINNTALLLLHAHK